MNTNVKFKSITDGVNKDANASINGTYQKHCKLQRHSCCVA